MFIVLRAQKVCQGKACTRRGGFLQISNGEIFILSIRDDAAKLSLTGDF